MRVASSTRPTIRTSGEREAQSAVISRTMSNQDMTPITKTGAQSGSGTRPEGASPRSHKPSHQKSDHEATHPTANAITAAKSQADGISDEPAQQKL